jgi:hypothetical protein
MCCELIALDRVVANAELTSFAAGAHPRLEVANESDDCAATAHHAARAT